MRTVSTEVKAYCDGSGSTSDPNCRYLTLAACVATPDAWECFEVRWRRVLEEHDSPPFHLGDARTLNGSFSGWSHQRVDALVIDLLQCFHEVLLMRHCNDFFIARCTVNLADYRRASAASSGVRSRSPENLCQSHATTVAMMMLPDDPSSQTLKRGRFEMWFDQNEPFQGYVQKEWERRKKDWENDVLAQLGTIAPADHRRSIGIQAADFIAWHTNRYFCTGDDKIGLVGGTLRHVSQPQYWEYENLMRAMPDGWRFTPQEIQP